MSAENILGMPLAPRISTPGVSGAARWLGALLRNLVYARIGTLEWGQLQISDRHGQRLLGPGDAGPQVHMNIHDDAFYAYIALSGSVGAGQAYFLGLWDCDNLTEMVRIFVRNRERMEAMEKGLARLSAPLHRFFHRSRDNSLRGSRRNISAHYDLGNDFFEQFLDASMTYSGGVFPTADASLEQAQMEKIDRICRKLALGPNDHLLEIGTGWGALAEHAAARYGARVTTTTISREQYDYARARIERAGLGDRVTLLCEDYRKLQPCAEQPYNRLASVEMIEAVGHQHFSGFFRQCARLLSTDGQAVIQAITIQDRYYNQMLRSVDFIQRYIFPGGCLPAVGALVAAARDASDLQLAHLEDFGPHYARTLQLWRERLLDALPRIRAQGYTDQFLRMWLYYLSYCEGGFLERLIGVSQFVFHKPGYRGAPLLNTQQG